MIAKSSAVLFWMVLKRYNRLFQCSVCLCALCVQRCAEPLQASQRHNSLMSISICVSYTFVRERERERGGWGRRKGKEKNDEETKSFIKALDSQSGAFFLKTAGESALCL